MASEKDKKANPFQQFTESIFSPIGGAVRGALRGLAPGTAEQHDLQKEQMRQFAESKKIQDLLRNAQIEALRGGTETDPMEKAGKLALAHERLTKAGADEAAGAVLGKINELTGAQAEIEKGQKATATEAVLSDYFQAGLGELEDKESGRASQEAVGKFEQGFARESQKQGFNAKSAELLFGKLYEEERGKAGILRDDVLPRRDVIDTRSYFSYDPSEPVKASKAGEYVKDMSEYFQASTPTVPEENIPKTYEQLGITNTDDMATLQEMQDAVPDVDLRQEYEEDPESMQRLMKLWREKKLNKKNLHKAFASIQQKARQSLGVA